MVKTPKTRHSRGSREPVTIDLDKDQVSRIADEGAAGAGPMPKQAAKPEPETPSTASVEAAGEEAMATKATHAGADAARAAARDPAAESAKDKPQPGSSEPLRPPRPDPAAEATRRGGMGMLAAGIVGGVIALAGAAGLQYAGVFGAPVDETAGNADNAQIVDLQAKVAELAMEKNDGTAAGQIDGLSAELGEVKSELASLKSAAAAADTGIKSGEALAALTQRVDQLASAVDALGEAARKEPADLGPLNEKLAALEQQMRTAGESVDNNQGRLAVLEQSLATLTGKIEAQADQPKIALAIAASALKSAVERGAPFSAELETFAAISPDAPQIAPLRAHAEKGVTPRSEIAAGAGAAADAMVAADNPVDENAGLMRRLMASAESLVKVRPIGAVEGAGVPETVARLEAAANSGDYGKALAEYGTLPEPVKAAGADFAAKLKARLEAETEVDALVARAMAGGEG